MRFIEERELETRKTKHIIEAIDENNSYIINEIVEMAISDVSTYLSAKYDVEFIFNQKGDKRNPTIKRIVIDFVTMYLFERFSSNEIPDSVTERYDKNIKMLQDLANGRLGINLPLKVENTSSIFRGGSSKQFINK